MKTSDRVVSEMRETLKCPSLTPQARQLLKLTIKVQEDRATAHAKSIKAGKRVIHVSHQMTRWASEIVTVADVSRFGTLRSCRNCGHEQARTVTGTHTHWELWKPCAAKKKRST